MSSILKALKRLEQEKAQRRDGEIDLSREILFESSRRKNRFPWPWAAAITTIVLLLSLVAILLVKRPSATTQTQLPAQPPTAFIAGQPETTPRTTIQPQPAVTPKAEVMVMQKQATAPPSARIPLSLPPQQPSVLPDSRPSLPATAAPVATTPARTEAPRKQAQPTESTEPVGSAFAVSGIAWNKDSADRLAVINGQPLTTGSAVGGAVVEEILPDKVRFSQGGKSFEVHLGKSGKTH